jgi:hypothetical protein
MCKGIPQTENINKEYSFAAVVYLKTDHLRCASLFHFSTSTQVDSGVNNEYETTAAMKHHHHDHHHHHQSFMELGHLLTRSVSCV